MHPLIYRNTRQGRKYQFYICSKEIELNAGEHTLAGELNLTKVPTLYWYFSIQELLAFKTY